MPVSGLSTSTPASLVPIHTWPRTSTSSVRTALLASDAASSFAFFGRYLEVEPPSRLVWTNDESEDAAVTTVTFEEKGGKTLLIFHELYPSKQALDSAIEGMEGGMPEQFEQLDELLVSLGASVGGS